MKFIELRSEDSEEYFCVNVEAISYTKVNKRTSGEVEIFLQGGFNMKAYVVGPDVDILRGALGLKPWDEAKRQS